MLGLKVMMSRCDSCGERFPGYIESNRVFLEHVCFECATKLKEIVELELQKAKDAKIINRIKRFIFGKPGEGKE